VSEPWNPAFEGWVPGNVGAFFGHGSVKILDILRVLKRGEEAGIVLRDDPGLAIR
jgi:hypothetical protein